MEKFLGGMIIVSSDDDDECISFRGVIIIESSVGEAIQSRAIELLD